jgi:GT2 family glycosyltransferase
MKQRRPLKIYVGIATVGRPAVLKATLAMVARQTRPPDRVLIAPASQADLAGVDLAAFGFEQVPAPLGSCAQRNAILCQLQEKNVEDDVIVFFDDDYFPCKDYLAAVERAFVEEPDIVMTTGTVIADDVTGPGLSVEAAGRLVEQAEQNAAPRGPRRPIYNGYGCHMAFRLAPTRQGVLFDERLPQYGWLEDVDFSRRLAPHGRIVKLPDARGVHLGSKSGRTPGVRLGYSQVVNPIYMVKKGTVAPSRALYFMLRNIAMNLARSLRPEPYIDRRGRLRGNMLGLIDAVRGKENPQRINFLT